MIIWWINQYAVTPDLPGGTRHYDLAVELGRMGHHVRVFASDVNLSLRRRTKLAGAQLYDVEDLNGVQFVWVRSAGYQRNDWRRAWNMLSFSLNLLRVARHMQEDSRPDVIIGSTPHPFAALAADYLARWCGARFVLEVRDLWPQALIDMGGLRESHPVVGVLRLLERRLYAAADRVIVLAKGAESYLAGRGVQPERLVYVPNGVHLDHFRSSADRQSNRDRFGFERFTIVYTGAHGPANALETILQTARMVRDLPVEFVLVGDGPAKDALLRLAKSLGVDNVRFMPPIPKREMADLLSAADAAVITLKNAHAFSYAVSPNKLFDYMAAGLPILCAVPGEIAHMVRTAQAGFVAEPENPADLAHAVRCLLALPAVDRQRMGRGGRAYIEANFDRRALARRLLRALGEGRTESETTGLVV
ncbi:glycosyltransferase family 4 protein [Symbiobacterium thermophilum]|uniref:Glycosyltransferase WbuB n=1 Tax=Symbiobacterium thermophilum TaxID=2734 RepID=A0A953LII2_SYMTR|nr:glycosyltransferase family 4 protein [Symbiobacterium thermophilum]MBY6277296.1 glycosyltransferase WbuB [Symbiobacterium thermophilum]